MVYTGYKKISFEDSEENKIDVYLKMPVLDKKLIVALLASAGVISYGSYLIGSSRGSIKPQDFDLSPRVINVNIRDKTLSIEQRSKKVKDDNKNEKVNEQQNEESIDKVSASKSWQKVLDFDISKISELGIDQKVLQSNPFFGVTMREVLDANRLEPNDESSLEHKVFWFRTIAGYPPEGRGEKIYPTDVEIKESIEEHCKDWSKQRPDAVTNAKYLFWCTKLNLTDDMTGKPFNERSGYKKLFKS